MNNMTHRLSESINDPYLGIIKYDRDRNKYTGRIKDKNNNFIEFSFDVHEDIQEVLKNVRKIIKNYFDRTLEFQLYAAEKLLDLYNDTWSEDEIIDKNEFVNRIALDSIVIYSDLNAECSAEFYYSDGDLFAGHFIVISTNSNNQLEDAYLPG